MRRIKSKNTSSEIILRKIIRELGFTGYRLHRKDLPGKPDLSWPGRKLAIFLHGCFWHGHDCPRGARVPKSNTIYWQTKIEKNRQRDLLHESQLMEKGWSVLIVWECELKYKETLMQKLKDFLS